MSRDYYAQHLSAQRLRQAYELASPRVRQYLDAELDHLQKNLRHVESLLELGCGYGRVLQALRDSADCLVGVDTSEASLEAARQHLPDPPFRFLCMNAGRLTFPDSTFDAVVCVQNGLSAFQLPPEQVVRESLRVLRPKGKALFSSYSPRFWKERLAWFRAQVAAGLLGPIDEQATGKGTIVCEDGFRATTLSREDFLLLARKLELPARLEEVDDSSLFCEFAKA